jgi:hypothetical protein
MKVRRYKLQGSWTIIFMIVGVLLWVLSCGDVATAGSYADTAHGNSSSGVKISGTECPAGIPCPQGDCGQCHDTFDPGICGENETMLFNPLDDPDFCFLCHTPTGSIQDGSMSAASRDVKTVVNNKTYRHDVTAYSGLHEFSPQQETRAYLSANKHVVCGDCHTPHAAKAELHSSNEAHVTASSNIVSDCPLAGAPGVEPTWSATNWGGATAWPTTTSAATMEYQICFKCHSDYVPWDDGGTGPASWTDVALEFNPSNQSYHPVVQALPETDPGSNGSSRLPPSHTSLVIGDSGKGFQRTTTRIVDWRGTEPLKTWADNQWVNWGLRIGSLSTGCQDKYFNPIRRIVENGVTTGAPDAPPWQKNYIEVDPPLSTIGSCYVMYSIEYYAGRGTKSGTTVTDTYKDFTLYLPSLVGYVVVISDDDGDYVAKGTVASNDATSFTVGSWTTMYGGVPTGTVGYYFSATGQSMMCSDCHSHDTISSAAAQGPHGSAVAWMLKGRNKGWPTWLASDNGTGNGGGTAYTRLYEVQVRDYYDGRGDAGAAGDGLFCLNCHSTVSFSKDANGRNSAYWTIHNRGQHEMIDCTECHIMVPHGYKNSRLIGDTSMPARYAFDNQTSLNYVYTFTKRTDPAGYSKNDCSTGGGTGGCHLY